MIRNMETVNKILDAVDLVCVHCPEDTLNNENICDTCPVRKLVEGLEKEQNNESNSY